MNKVGFIDLNVKENSFKLEEQIKRELRSRWLDHETSKEFHDQIYKLRRAKGGLKGLLREIQTEIKSRMRVYGTEGVINESTGER